MVPLLDIVFVLTLSSIVGLGFSAIQNPRFVMVGPPLVATDLIRPKAIVAPRANRVSPVTDGCANNVQGIAVSSRIVENNFFSSMIFVVSVSNTLQKYEFFLKWQNYPYIKKDATLFFYESCIFSYLLTSFSSCISMNCRFAS